MKRHYQLDEDYLDRLEIGRAKKNASFVLWTDVKKKLDKKHGINPRRLQNGKVNKKDNPATTRN